MITSPIERLGPGDLCQVEPGVAVHTVGPCGAIWRTEDTDQLPQVNERGREIAHQVLAAEGVLVSLADLAMWCLGVRHCLPEDPEELRPALLWPGSGYYDLRRVWELLGSMPLSLACQVSHLAEVTAPILPERDARCLVIRAGDVRVLVPEVIRVRPSDVRAHPLF